MTVKNQEVKRAPQVLAVPQEVKSHHNGLTEPACDAPEGDAWVTARRRLQVLAESNPELAHRLALLLDESEEEPILEDEEDDVIRRARAGEFGKEVFLDWFGEELAEKLKTTSFE